MSLFIGQLIGFGVIVFILMRYAAPPVRKLMAAQQQAVRTQLEESAKAAKRLTDADSFHAERLELGRGEARQIVDEASADALRVAELLRLQAEAESERLKGYGDQQVIQLRAQRIRELRAQLGSDALRRAGEIVRVRVADPREQSATVDRFLDELEAMAPVAEAPDLNPTDLRPASRDAQLAAVTRFDELATALSDADLSQLASELAAVDSLLVREPILARHLAESSGSADAKQALLEQLLSGKVGPTTLDILSIATSQRWSATEDLVQTVEHVARLALLERAKREDHADEVAEQLFRFGRVLQGQPQLTSLLSDYREPAAARVNLLRAIVDGGSGASGTATALLAQTVELLHGQRADHAVEELTNLAVARQGEIVAQVSAAAELSDAQRQRLTDVLSRIYRHPISVHLTIDPSPLGGLSVAVGDEVIDGTLSSRLAAATTQLPD